MKCPHKMMTASPGEKKEKKKGGKRRLSYSKPKMRQREEKGGGLGADTVLPRITSSSRGRATHREGEEEKGKGGRKNLLNPCLVERRFQSEPSISTEEGGEERGEKKKKEERKRGESA